jgi:thermitase
MIGLEEISPIYYSDRKLHPQQLTECLQYESLPPLAADTFQKLKRDPSPIDFKNDTETLHAFTKAGWFVPPHSPLAPIGTPEDSADPRRTGDLVRKVDDRRLAILRWRLVVQFKPEVSEEEALKILQSKDLKKVRTLRFGDRLYEAEVLNPEGKPPHEVTPAKVRELEKDKLHVKFAEPSLIEYLGERSLQTPDPELDDQWQWDALGVKDLWFKEGIDGQGQTIAVIDAGFQANHRDLIENIDIKRSAYFDDQDELVQGVRGIESLQHGTMCAGMAAARLGNGIMGCGAAPRATLMLVAMGPYGVASQVKLARALAYCARPEIEGAPVGTPGADIISCSLGPNKAIWQRMKVLGCATEYAVREGRPSEANEPLGSPIFWATANFDHEIPASSVTGDKNVIAVGVFGQGGKRAPCGYGTDYEFLAPGQGVLTTTKGHRFDPVIGGASLAAPCAAGVSALLLSKNPKLKWTEVKDLLLASSQSSTREVPHALGVSRQRPIQSRRLNAGNALVALAAHLREPSPPTL